jgi:hypothetical protein
MHNSEYSEAAKIPQEDLAERAKKILEELGKIDPNSVLCMMGLVVHSNGDIQTVIADDKGKLNIHAFVLGGDDDIAKMFTTLVTVAKNGMVRANAPENHDNEVKH